MQLPKYAFIVFTLFLFLLTSCSNDAEMSDVVEEGEIVLDVWIIDVDGVSVSAEIADTGPERMRGLMFREELCYDCGMLFIFDDVDIRSFWMKNTLIPLDMVFIDSEGTIVNILQAEPCVSDPCEHYYSGFGAKYVLELNKGFCEKNNISIGDIVEI